MPSYREHVAAGCCVWVGAYFIAQPHLALGPTQWAELALCTVVGSLFPDVDTKSKGQQLFYTLMALLIVTLVAQKNTGTALFIALYCLMPLTVKHRGLFHNLWFLSVSIGAAALAVTHYFPLQRTRISLNALFFFLGVVSHLILDRYVRIPPAFQRKKR